MREILRLVANGRVLLSASGRRSLRAFVANQLLLAMLDTAALYLISTIFAQGLNNSSIEIEAGGITILLVVALFTMRSILSTFFTWRTMKILARDEAEIGQGNLVAFLDDPASHTVGTEVNDLFNTVDRGPGAMVSGVLFSYYSLVAESLSALAIMGTLLYLQPTTAVTTSVFFLSVAFVQHRILSHRSTRAGEEVVESTQTVYGAIADVFSLSKVLAVMPSSSALSHIKYARESLLNARLRSSFLAILPRYFMELVLALGLAIVAGTTYLTGGQADAVRSITVFGAAGFRLLPIVNRVQSLVLQMLTLSTSASLATREDPNQTDPVHKVNHDMQNILEFRDVSYSYPSGTCEAISGVTLDLVSGLQYAIIGPSGAGKTTLVDLALGILQPSEGEIRRSVGVRLGYVPQDTHIARLPLDLNIALEWDGNAVDKLSIDKSISSAELVTFNEQNDTTTPLGPLSLSGGQKQRIGLARAFYRSPTLLVLDEVTSALDAETESIVMSSIHELKGKATVVIVAHRLSTVQHADIVIYVDGGRVVGTGTFDELRRSLPQLQRQIQLGTLNLED